MRQAVADPRYRRWSAVEWGYGVVRGGAAVADVVRERVGVGVCPGGPECEWADLMTAADDGVGELTWLARETSEIAEQYPHGAVTSVS